MEFNEMTRDDLRKAASAADIKGRGRMTRAQLVNALNASQAASVALSEPDPMVTRLAEAGYDSETYNLEAIAEIIGSWQSEDVDVFLVDGMLEFIAVRHKKAK